VKGMRNGELKKTGISWEEARMKKEGRYKEGGGRRKTRDPQAEPRGRKKRQFFLRKKW